MNRIPSRLQSIRLLLSGLAIASCIGIPASLLHPIPAQGQAAELFRIPPGNKEMRDFLDAGFRQGEGGWERAWRRAAVMGECLTPFLVHELEVENNAQSRLLLIATLGVATRHAARILSERVVAPRPQERMMASFALTVGPIHSEGADPILRLLRRDADPMELIGICLALDRFADVPRLPGFLYDKHKDPGVLAAALRCQPALGAAEVKARIERFGEHPHAPLIARGFLLSSRHDAGAIAEIDRWARELLHADDPTLRAAAAFHLSRRPGGGGVDEQALLRSHLDERLILARSPRLRAQVLDRRLIEAALAPPPSLAPQLRSRWCVLVARSAPVAELGQALALWREDRTFEEVRGAVALALAWRAFAVRGDRDAVRPLVRHFTGLPECSWLQLAVGQGGETAAPTDIEPSLAIALTYARRGQLPDEDCADLMSRTLWERHLHPGCAALDVERQFLGEILLDGSPSAGTRFVGSDRAPYIAKGLGREDLFFKIAYELFKFVRRTEPWTRLEYRLRN